MKKYVLFPLIFLLSTLSCKKKEAPDDPYNSYHGTLNAERNGKQWNPKLIALSVNKDSFSLLIVDYKKEFTRERVGFGLMPLQKGYYSLEEWQEWDTTTNAIVKAGIPVSYTHGSDIYIPTYLRKDHPRFISISSYDSVNNRVNGTFSLSFGRDSIWSPSGTYLDTVSYTNGSFSAPIQHPDELPE